MRKDILKNDLKPRFSDGYFTFYEVLVHNSSCDIFNHTGKFGPANYSQHNGKGKNRLLHLHSVKVIEIQHNKTENQNRHSTEKCTEELNDLADCSTAHSRKDTQRKCNQHPEECNEKAKSHGIFRSVNKSGVDVSSRIICTHDIDTVRSHGIDRQLFNQLSIFHVLDISGWLFMYGIPRSKDLREVGQDQ